MDMIKCNLVKITVSFSESHVTRSRFEGVSSGFQNLFFTLGIEICINIKVLIKKLSIIKVFWNCFVFHEIIENNLDTVINLDKNINETVQIFS